VDEVQGRIAALWTYPVKGCRGVALEEALLEPRGLAHDRRWMIVTPDGRFRTQRELPLLATIEAVVVDRWLRLRRGTDELSVPAEGIGEPMVVTLWSDRVEALRPDARADAALSDWLGHSVRLVRFLDHARRRCDPAHAGAQDHTAFADGFPVLVTSDASLREVNEALLERGEEPVAMERFRPNAVLSGIPPRAEDAHRRVELAGGAALRLVARCDRCVVTTTDQRTSERFGPEPLATLRRIRRNALTGGAWFGQNAVPTLPDGEAVLLRVDANAGRLQRGRDRGRAAATPAVTIDQQERARAAGH
jgi:uncharacterized protein YcbX